MKLFKLFSVSALMLGAVAVSNAQETQTSNTNSMSVKWGVKGGVNFATLNGGDIKSPDSRTSFHVGVLAEFPIADIFSLQAEVLYSGQGADFGNSVTITNPVTGVPTTFSQDVELQLDYINVPVLAKFYILEGLALEAGPQFSFLVNDEWDTNPTGNSGDSESFIRQTAKTFEVGAVGGISFVTPMGLFAYGRYNQGITDIADDYNVQNSVFQLGVGYKF